MRSARGRRSKRRWRQFPSIVKTLQRSLPRSRRGAQSLLTISARKRCPRSGRSRCESNPSDGSDRRGNIAKSKNGKSGSGSVVTGDGIRLHMLDSQLAHTYSIVARDPETGEMGVAVESHYFAVGSAVTWAEAGVGIVATQALVEPAYGKLGLDLMRAVKSA